MNVMGEEWITNRTTNVIKKFFTSQTTVPIILEWKKKSMKRSQVENEGDKRTNNRTDSKATNENE
jgi:hypothetical protein